MIPKSMKALMYYGPDDLRVEEMPTPKIGPGELLVRVRASGVCSGEAMDWYMARKAPLVPGHEPAGVVVAVGEGVEGFQIGDRVFAHHHVPCMTCEPCRRGRYVQCPAWREKTLDPGAMAEFMRVSARAVQLDTLKLPADLSFEDGTLIEPLACSVKAAKVAGIRPGDRVLVVGLGVMGILNARVAQAYGAALVAGTDLNPWRLQKARSLGIEPVFQATRPAPLASWAREVTEGHGFDVVIVGPGIARVIETYTALVAGGGTLLLFTPTAPDDPVTLDFYDLYVREVRVVPSYSAGPYDTREALELLRRRVIRAEEVVTHRFPLERAPEAYRLLKQAGESLKILVLP